MLNYHYLYFTHYITRIRITIMIVHASKFNRLAVNIKLIIFYFYLAYTNILRTQNIGIRQVEIKNNQFYINGQSIKFRGVNYHDSDPNTGYVMSEIQIVII